MQITPDILKQFAETTVEKITRGNFDIMSAYLRGSLALGDDPLLGGTTDIDLVFIHSDTPAIDREILRLTDDVHLDIEHHSQKRYLKGRELRVHPQMGPSLFNAQVLFDPQHFLDFTIATVRGMFHRADHTIMRAQPLITKARQDWMTLENASAANSVESVPAYLSILEAAANALALLVGEPLSERRFLPAFADRVEHLDRTGMYAGLIGLLGGALCDINQLRQWMTAWDAAFSASPVRQRPKEISSYRRNYYYSAFDALISSERPKDLLWPLLRTWTLIAAAFPEGDAAAQSWQAVCSHLGLCGPEFRERLTALDIYLEQVEETLEMWALEHGA